VTNGVFLQSTALLDAVGRLVSVSPTVNKSKMTRCNLSQNCEKKAGPRVDETVLHCRSTCET
jgi:hypothetical protein